MIRVMLVDDHAVVREGYRRLLECQGDLQVVAEAGDGQQALLAWREQQPEVTVVDLALPGLGGLELISRLRQRDPRARLLAFSMHRDPVWATQALRAGALGYVTKSSPPEALVAAVREVARGHGVLSDDIAAHAEAPAAPPPHLTLSAREFDVLRGLLQGASLDQIAEALHISPKTVSNLQTALRQKLGVANAVELLRYAQAHGLA